MKKIILFGAMVLALVITAFAPVPKSNHSVSLHSSQTDKWTLDKAHTNVKFSVTHLVISDVDGSFKTFDGTMESSKPDFSDAKISFSAEVASINTDNEKRDGHLKSPDFFDATKYPEIKFTSTSFVPLGDNKYTLVGNLTIRDVTKPVTFDVKYGGTAKSFDGGIHAGFKATSKIDRFDYNLKWNAATEAGGAVVGKEVDITLNVDFKKS
jgi:polyisoprenoid-binding protein YceI